MPLGKKMRSSLSWRLETATGHIIITKHYKNVRKRKSQTLLHFAVFKVI